MNWHSINRFFTQSWPIYWFLSLIYIINWLIISLKYRFFGIIDWFFTNWNSINRFFSDRYTVYWFFTFINWNSIIYLCFSLNILIFFRFIKIIGILLIDLEINSGFFLIILTHIREIIFYSWSNSWSNSCSFYWIWTLHILIGRLSVLWCTFYILNSRHSIHWSSVFINWLFWSS